MTDASFKEKKPIWNVPNILTMIRVVLIIPFVILLLVGREEWNGSGGILYCVLAEAIFIIASLTDLVDGKIARKYNLVTNFGKFMDPLADKLLVCAALICLVDMSKIPAWVVIVIISREFIISGFRLVASDAGIVIAASYWGKFKTTFQMLMIITMLAEPLLAGFRWFTVLAQSLMWIALLLTVISLIDYLYKNRKVML